MHPGDDLDLDELLNRPPDVEESDPFAYWDTDAGQAEIAAFNAAFDARLAEEEAVRLAAAAAAARPAWAPRPALALPVAEVPPAPKRPLKRAAPGLDRIAFFPGLACADEREAWAARLGALTTATDPQYVARVGINALVALRHVRWRNGENRPFPLAETPSVLEPLWEKPC
jgi:hypothetical protein